MFLFGGATADYNRATDIPDKLDYPGLQRITAFTWQLLDELGSPAGYEWFDLGTRTPPGGGRRAFFGVIPDFAADANEGVVVAGTVPGSPAETAGLLEGDILREINGRPTPDLQALTDILRDLKPGDTVEVVFLRDGVVQHTTARVAAQRDENGS